jgi:excisionase family DNA binding protein
VQNQQTGRTTTVPDAARQLGVHHQTLRKAIKAGTVPFRVIDLGGVLRIPQADLDKLVGPR